MHVCLEHEEEVRQNHRRVDQLFFLNRVVVVLVIESVQICQNLEDLYQDVPDRVNEERDQMDVYVPVLREYKAQSVDSGFNLADCVDDDAIGCKHHTQYNYLVQIVIIRQQSNANAGHVRSDYYSIHQTQHELLAS